jgi:hypothetical protein
VVLRTVGHERHAGGRGGDAVHPGVTDHHGVARDPEVLHDDAPAVGIGLERAHLVAGDDQVEEGQQPEAGEGLVGDLARVVGPHRGREAGRAGAVDGLARAGLQRGRRHRAPLVVERHLPQRLLHVRRVGLAPADQLAHAVAIRPARQQSAMALQQRAHVQRHRRQVQRRLDERVIEVEDAQTHALTVPWTCYAA